MESKVSSEKKLLRHMVYISNDHADEGRFNVDISLPFEPHEMKVKQIAFSNVTGELIAGVFTIHCDSLTGRTGIPLGSFIDGCVSFVGMTFPTPSSARGTHTIEIRQEGVISDATDTGTLSLFLEFRRYA